MRYRNPVYDGYFADPFVMRTGDGYIAYGTGSRVDGRIFEVLTSDDLVNWRRAGGALEEPRGDLGTDYWAPEAVEVDGEWFLYYSVGRGDVGHHLRVARANSPLGPFRDAGVDLTPGEHFAIDPHPFRGADGTWYLFYARDVLDGDRIGTMLAVDVLEPMTSLGGEPRTVLRPSADWQMFRRGRQIYGQTYDWHTLEGPFVRPHAGRLYCFYSAGAWEEPTYGVSYAVADHPLGPWTQAAGEPLLRTVPDRVIGPGHLSVVTGPHGGDVVAYGAWDPAQTGRRMCIDPLLWTPDGPRIAGPTWESTDLPDRA